jgi:hypothetical protein
MELKTISLSPSLQTRLQTALQVVADAFPVDENDIYDERLERLDSKAVPLLSEAFAAALFPTQETNLEKFNLPPLPDSDRSISSLLSDSLINLITGQGTPAFVIDGLPKDSPLHEYALWGLSSIVQPTRAEYDRITHVYLSKKPLLNHAAQGLHADEITTSPGVKELAFFLSGRKVGANPLPTNVATIDELIEKTTDLMWESSEFGKQSVGANKQELRNQIIETLKSPLWSVSKGPFWEKGAEITERHHKTPMIYSLPADPNSSEDRPHYGLLHSPQKVRYGISVSTLPPFVNEVAKNLDNALFYLKDEAAGVVLQPGQVLAWNNNLVVHGAGTFKNPPSADELKPRWLSRTIAARQNLTPEEEKTPGANGLYARVNSGKLWHRAQLAAEKSDELPPH